MMADWQGDYLQPQWPAPGNVRSAITLRSGGFSCGPYASNNLATHVGDDGASVARNRQRLREQLQLPADPCWLDQVHGTDVIRAGDGLAGSRADGSYSQQSAIVCAVLTADCLPVLLCNLAGDQVAAVHAGWRGLASGILSTAIASFDSPAEQILVFLGPAIGAEKFQVGEDVRQAFLCELPTERWWSAVFIAKATATWRICMRWRGSNCSGWGSSVFTVVGTVHRPMRRAFILTVEIYAPVAMPR